MRPHQNIVLQASPLRVHSISRFGECSKKGALWLYLADVIDPQNIGSLIRSAMYFGIAGVILSRGCAALTPIVSKASAGALELAAEGKLWRSSLGSATFLRDARTSGTRIIGTCVPVPSKNPMESDPPFNATEILVIGSEGFGLSETIKNECTNFMTIPKAKDSPPWLDSLNASVAGSVLLWQLTRSK